MDFVDLFPTVITHTFPPEINSSDILKFKEFVNTLDYINESDKNGKLSVSQQVLNNSIFTKLNTCILDLSRKYLKEIGHEFIDIQIASSWVNIVDASENIHMHRHANSYLSGVYYFQDSSPIKFRNPHMDNWIFLPKLKPHNFRSSTNFQLTPLSNSLIIFPSWLYHAVLPSNVDGRISLAFNIIPKGEFGENTAKLYFK